MKWIEKKDGNEKSKLYHLRLSEWKSESIRPGTQLWRTPKPTSTYKLRHEI